MTTADPVPASFLVADCGSTNTTVVLFDVVDGVYRFIAGASAPTTRHAPWSDIVRGVQHAVNRVGEITGRLLLDEEGNLITPARGHGMGVDHFAATISASDPLRCLPAGLQDDVSVASARHALQSIYAVEVDRLSLEDRRNGQQQAQVVAETRPDLILISGGTDGGATERVLNIIEPVYLGLNMMSGSQRPQIIYAGNVQLREKVRELLGGLTTFHVAANVRPTLEVEQLDDAVRLVGEVFEDVKLGEVPGVDELADWSGRPLIPTVRAFATIVEYFAALYDGGVLGVDIGSDSVTLVAAEPRYVRVVVRSDLGLGRPMANILNHVKLPQIARWLPSESDADALRDFVVGKALHPQSVPVNDTGLHREQAVAREFIRLAAEGAPAQWRGGGDGRLPPFTLLLARGAVLTGAPRPGQALLTLLDGLQPVGIFSVAIDRHGALPALGALAAQEPLLAVQALEGGVLVDLGFVIALDGRGTAGQKALSVHMKTDEGAEFDIEVQHGTLEILPLAPGHAADLTLTPARGVDLGFGRGRNRKVRIHGGAVGLVIDARGRPLPILDNPVEQAARAYQWLWDVGG